MATSIFAICLNLMTTRSSAVVASLHLHFDLLRISFMILKNTIQIHIWSGTSIYRYYLRHHWTSCLLAHLIIESILQQRALSRCEFFSRAHKRAFN